MKIAKDLAVVAAIVVVLAVVLVLFSGVTAARRSSKENAEFNRTVKEAKTLFPEFTQQVIGHWGDEIYWRRCQYCMESEGTVAGDVGSFFVDLAFGAYSEYDPRDDYEKPLRRCCNGSAN